MGSSSKGILTTRLVKKLSKKDKNGNQEVKEDIIRERVTNKVLSNRKQKEIEKGEIK